MKTVLAIAIGVSMTHYLVKPIAALFGDPDGLRAWLQYAFNGAMDAALFVILAGVVERQRAAPLVMSIGILFCCLGELESAQVAVCGMASIGRTIAIPFSSTLCLERFGPIPYAATVAAVLVYMLRRRHDERSRPHS